MYVRGNFCFSRCRRLLICGFSSRHLSLNINSEINYDEIPEYLTGSFGPLFDSDSGPGFYGFSQLICYWHCVIGTSKQVIMVEYC